MSFSFFLFLLFPYQAFFYDIEAESANGNNPVLLRISIYLRDLSERSRQRTGAVK